MRDDVSIHPHTGADIPPGHEALVSRLCQACRGGRGTVKRCAYHRVYQPRDGVLAWLSGASASFAAWLATSPICDACAAVPCEVCGGCGFKACASDAEVGHELD